MTKLDEFLGPLNNGVWEVVVPKESVTEPLDTGWVKSPINVPTPGTIASYRKGQYHVHEQQTEWHVHLDNHDPKVHPYLHLVDDAPLLLMIGDTVVTLIAGTRKKTGNEKEILEDQKRSWKEQVLVGVLLMLVGVFIASNPMLAFEGIMLLLVPLAISRPRCHHLVERNCVQPHQGPSRGALISRDRDRYRGNNRILPAIGIVDGCNPWDTCTMDVCECDYPARTGEKRSFGNS